MPLSLWIIAVVTLTEAVLMVLIFVFFLRLRRSEELLLRLQNNQEKVLERIHTNAELEQELVGSFGRRQEQLQELNQRLEERIEIIRRLLEQAEGISRSPQFLRELILNGRRKGRTPAQIAREAGLTVDEVELILAQNAGRQ